MYNTVIYFLYSSYILNKYLHKITTTFCFKHFKDQLTNNYICCINSTFLNQQKNSNQQKDNTYNNKITRTH